MLFFSQDLKYMGDKSIADSEVSKPARGKETYILTHNEYTWWALYLFTIEVIPERHTS